MSLEAPSESESEIWVSPASEFWTLVYPRVIVSVGSILPVVLTVLGVFKVNCNSQILNSVIGFCNVTAGMISYTSIVFPFIDQTKTKHYLISLWASFFILYLGGTDTVTALSFEDNQLWRGKAYKIIFKGFLYAIVILQCSVEGMDVIFLVMVMLISICGVYNCFERILALKHGSMDELESSSLDQASTAALDDYADTQDGLANERLGIPTLELPSHYTPCEILVISHRLYMKFRGLYTDSSAKYSSADRTTSRSLIVRMRSNDALQVVDNQILLMREEVHSRALLSHTKRGLIIRLCNLSVIVYFGFWLIGFFQGRAFPRPDIFITFLLFILEVIRRGFEFALLVVSRRQIVRVHDSNWTIREQVVKQMLKFHSEENPKLSMGQINLFDFLFKVHQPSCFNTFMQLIFSKEVCENYFLTKQVAISNIWDKIFEVLKDKSQIRGENNGDYNSLTRSRGVWALRQHNNLDWSVTDEFSRSALMWIIATTLLHHDFPGLERSDNLKSAKCFSDYFLHLLMAKPVLLSSVVEDVVKTSVDTFNELKRILSDRLPNFNEHEACRLLLDNNDLGGDERSVFRRGIKLAKDLRQLDEQVREMILCEVWVEMLSYIAINCRGYYHAQLLGQGKEFLTILRLITVQLGLGKQFEFEDNV